MPRPSCLVALALVVGACGPEEELGHRSDAIVNGEADTLHPEVGIVLGAQSCTGTLVGRRTVLTAAHCVAGAPVETVAFLPAGKAGERIAASAVVVHPAYQGGNRGDLALIRLELDAPAQPARLAARAPREGEEVELVGYGVPLEGSLAFGERRRATNRVSSLEPETFSVRGTEAGRGNLCNGDSGGPSFTEGGVGERLLIGVHSTKSGLCGQLGTDMRVDGALPWIRASADDLIEGEDGPQLRIASPAPRSVVGRRFLVEVEASREVRAVELRAAGLVQVATRDGTGRFAVELELPDGAARVQVLALDAGRELSAVVEIQVDALAGSAQGCSAASARPQAGCGALLLLVLVALAAARRRA